MAGKRKRFAQRRKACGYSQEALAEALQVDRTTVQRWERGVGDPHPHQRPLLAKLLHVELEELDDLLAPDISVDLPTVDRERGDGFACAIRHMSQQLIMLDNELNGLPIAEIAARSFKKVHRRLGNGDYDRKAEHEIQSAAAELAEIAGWALFNEGKFNASRRFNQEALLLAKLACDRSTELITLQNMGMLAGWSGRPREELAIAQSVIERERMSPRVEAMFRAREGQGLAGTGHHREAARSFGRARSLLLDNGPDSEPTWVWWVSDQEIDRQQGRSLHEIGDLHAAIPVLERAMHHQEGSQVGYRSVAAVRLLDSLLRVRSWQTAEVEARNLVPAVNEMSSVITLEILTKVAGRGKATPGAPSSLRDTLEQIESIATEDPYDF
ncbi:helix-turn-helix transcriptional regulator [Streptomyces sp. NPDC002490]|uniref:helix-turn-helix transcriptional regulator n=1 Tax=Streptomyces sp. NPDC002490 TaxID=3154416 RepID=UPI00331E55E8